MSNTVSVDQLVSNYLNKVKRGNVKEELLYAENLPNTESVAQLLQRVTKTPQILHSLITTSLPYLLITPQKNKKRKLMHANNKIRDHAPQKVKTRLNKKTKSVGGLLAPSARSETHLISQSLAAATKLQINKIDSGKKKLPTRKGNNKTLNKSLKSNSNLLSVTKGSVTSITKRKGHLIKKEHILSEVLKKSLLDDSINSQNKISNALKHSSLFSITEKSHLSLNNYAPVEVDTILLQKLVALDKKEARKVINKILNIEEDLLEPESDKSSSTDDEVDDKTRKKKKKSDVKQELIKELRNILLVRLKTDKERPAEILYNVILKLCKKNKIVNNIQFRRGQQLKKNTTEPQLSRSHNRMTSKRLKQGSQKLKTLINQHQLLLEKMHS